MQSEAYKRCTRCGERQPPAEFYANARYADGRENWCKPCKRANARENQRRRWSTQTAAQAAEARTIAAGRADRVDDAFGHWLAGFFDGEGSFTIRRNTRAEYCSYTCSAQLAMRDDESPILGEIAARLGAGRIYIYRRANKPERNGCAMWLASSKVDCLTLVYLLRRCQPRAKKARDFEVWAEAVDHWVDVHAKRAGVKGRADWAPMAEMQQRLWAGRKYGAA